MATQVKIRNALESRIAVFAASKSVPVAVENKSFTPTGDYIEVSLFPAATKDPSFGALHKRYSGIFRVVYYSTGLNKGMAAIETLADEIVNLFPRGLAITKDDVVVNIETTPTQSGPGFMNGYIFVAVSAYYRTDVITN